MTKHREPGEDETPPLVSGSIVIATTVPDFENATIHVWLEDIGRVDAEADSLAETLIDRVVHAAGGSGQATVVPFEIRLDTTGSWFDPRKHYAVRAWVDRDSDGREGPGDLYSTESHRVLTRGFGDTATITLDNQ